MPFSTVIASQRRPAQRLTSAQDLLLHPIRDNPTASPAAADGDWVREHGTKLRFYVGGLEWLIDSTGLTTDVIATYRGAAASEIGQTAWREGLTRSVLVRQQMKGSWGAIARQQYFEVSMTRPVQFPKAALFILSCELALQDLIDRSRLPSGTPTIGSGAEVYSRMAIVPACWYIPGFDKTYLASQIASMPHFLVDLTKYAKQTKPEVIEDVASGYMVTYETARLISEFCAGHNLNATPRCSAGRTALGTGHASKHEMVDL